jgi:hypothetical protein
MVFWAGQRSTSFGGLGVPGGPQKPCQEVGGEAPHRLEWFLGPPGPPRPQRSSIAGQPKNHALKTQVYKDLFLPKASDARRTGAVWGGGAERLQTKEGGLAGGRPSREGGGRGVEGG